MITTQIEQHIATITIDRPERKNALTPAMYQSMVDALRAFDADDAVRVALITGTDEMFCSGNDLADFLNSPPRCGQSCGAIFVCPARL